MNSGFQGYSRNEIMAHALGYRVVNAVVLAPSGKKLNPWQSSTGYPCITICKKQSGSRLTSKCFVHRLVAFQLWGDAIYQPGLVVRHADSNPQNFSESNIRLGTHTENMMDKPAELRRRCAVTATRVAQKHDHAAILAHYRESHSYRKTMEAFGIKSKGTLSFIVRKSMTANSNTDVLAMLPPFDEQKAA